MGEKNEKKGLFRNEEVLDALQIEAELNSLLGKRGHEVDLSKFTDKVKGGDQPAVMSLGVSAYIWLAGDRVNELLSVQEGESKPDE